MQKFEKRKTNMDTRRSKKKIGTYEGPKVLKKNEHMKAHKMKKMMIAMSQNKKLEREHTYKRSIV